MGGERVQIYARDAENSAFKNTIHMKLHCDAMAKRIRELQDTAMTYEKNFGKPKI